MGGGLQLSNVCFLVIFRVSYMFLYWSSISFCLSLFIYFFCGNWNQCFTFVLNIILWIHHRRPNQHRVLYVPAGVPASLPSVRFWPSSWDPFLSAYFVAVNIFKCLFHAVD